MFGNQPQTLILCIVVFSILIGRGATIFCSHWLDSDLSVAMPALLCHKEPAELTKRGISCLSLVLYGIRVLVEAIPEIKPGH